MNIEIECPCGYKSYNKEDFDEEGLCRNCEAGKLDVRGE